MILEKIQQILAQQFEVSADSINADTNIVMTSAQIRF